MFTDDETVFCRNAGHQQGGAKSSVALIEGLAVLVIADPSEASFSLPNHVVHKLRDPGRVVHVELVRQKGRSIDLRRTVDKENREIEGTQHVCIQFVKYFKADDTAAAVGGKSDRKAARPEILLCNAVDIQGISQLSDFPLKLIQHQGSKMGRRKKLCGEERELALKRGGCMLGLCSPECWIVRKSTHVGELFVSHFNGFLQNFFSGRFRKAA